MALSDYLTGEEWDACFYAWMGQHRAPNFGESMRKTISVLLSKGYRFPGLNADGSKNIQVCDGVNAQKIGFFFGNLCHVDTNELLSSGRTFLKTHAPELVDETDDEWKHELEKSNHPGSPTERG